MSWLPLQDDIECAQEAHTYLADLLEARHQSVLPALPQAIRAVAIVSSLPSDVYHHFQLETQLHTERPIAMLSWAQLRLFCKKCATKFENPPSFIPDIGSESIP